MIDYVIPRHKMPPVHTTLQERTIVSLVTSWIIDSVECQKTTDADYKWRRRPGKAIPYTELRSKWISNKEKADAIHQRVWEALGYKRTEEDLSFVYRQRDKAIVRNNRKKQNTIKHQLDWTLNHYDRDQSQYLIDLLDLTKKRWHTSERYNIIMYAFTLPTTHKMYPWIKDLMDKYNLGLWRSIYMTTDHCVPLECYINNDSSDNMRIISPLDPINRHMKTRENQTLKRQAKKSGEQYRPNECINTARIIHAPDYALITFAAELIEIHNNQASDKSIQSMMDVTCRASTPEEYHPIMNSAPPKRASLEELIAYEERKAWL